MNMSHSVPICAIPNLPATARSADLPKIGGDATCFFVVKTSILHVRYRISTTNNKDKKTTKVLGSLWKNKCCYRDFSVSRTCSCAAWHKPSTVSHKEWLPPKIELNEWALFLTGLMFDIYGWNLFSDFLEVFFLHLFFMYTILYQVVPSQLERICVFPLPSWLFFRTFSMLKKFQGSNKNSKL